MQQNRWIISIVSSALLLLWSGQSNGQIGTAQVFRAEVKMNGRFEYESLGVLRVDKIQLDSDDLVNLALNQELGTSLPNNQVLALLVNCNDNSAALAVFDKKAQTVIAVIAQFTTGRAFQQGAQKGEMMLTGNFDNIGPSDWRIEGGQTSSSGKQQIDAKISNCAMKSYSGKGQALLNLRITGVDVQGLFNKVSIKTKDNLGTITP